MIDFPSPTPMSTCWTPRSSNTAGRRARRSWGGLDHPRPRGGGEALCHREHGLRRGRRRHPQHLDEAEWVQQLAGGDSRLKGCVASLPLEQGAQLEADLEKLSSFPVVRGIRRLIQNKADPEFVLRPDFIAATRLLPKFNYSFDICIFHHQFGNVIEFVRRCPEVSFILDHIGKPGIRDGLMEPWKRHSASCRTAQRQVQTVGRHHRGRPRKLDARPAPALHRPCHRQLRLQPHHVWRRLAGGRAGRKIYRLDRRARLGDGGLHPGREAQAVPRQRNSRLPAVISWTVAATPASRPCRCRWAADPCRRTRFRKCSGAPSWRLTSGR